MTRIEYIQPKKESTCPEMLPLIVTSLWHQLVAGVSFSGVLWHLLKIHETLTFGFSYNGGEV